MGPELYDDPRSKRKRKPEWVRILEEDADNDPEVARLLEDTDGDPDRIREKMKFALKETDMRREGQGSDVPPHISFRAISPMGLWVWLEFLDAPLPGEREMLEGMLKSWFAVGKLGGYNSQNLQVYQNADDDQSFFEYDNDELGAGENRMASYIHDIGEVEYQDNWARVWIDMGTADELSLDVLLNMLVGFSAEMCGLKSIRLGGVNEDWPVPDEFAELGPDADSMKVGMNPMRLPEGLDEEFQFMDEEGLLEGGKGRRGGGPRPSSLAAAAVDAESYEYDSRTSSSGYGIRAGPYGASAEERELQQLAARLRRPVVAASRGRGYYGAGGADGRLQGPVANLDLDPDEFEFTDGDGDGDDDTQGSGGAEGGAAAGGGAAGGGSEPKRPWGASFVRRVNKGSRGRGGS